MVDAIQSGEPPAKLRDELGDLLFQVVFYAQMAQERGWFDFDAIARAIHDKLVRRHPHVFGQQASARLSQHPAGGAGGVGGTQGARARRRCPGCKSDAGVLADVPRALPALTRAQKLGKRAGPGGL